MFDMIASSIIIFNGLFGIILIILAIVFYNPYNFNGEALAIFGIMLIGLGIFAHAVIYSSSDDIISIETNGYVYLKNGEIKQLPPHLQDDFNNMTYETFKEKCEKLHITSYKELENIKNLNTTWGI